MAMAIHAVSSQKKALLIIIKNGSRFSDKLFINKQCRTGIKINDILRLPANIYWKNKYGFYLGCNEENAKTVRLHTVNDVVGSRIGNYANEKTAETIENTDQLVISSKISQYTMEYADIKGISQSIVDPLQLAYLSIKQPLYAPSGIVIGMLVFLSI